MKNESSHILVSVALPACSRTVLRTSFQLILKWTQAQKALFLDSDKGREFNIGFA